MQFNPFQTDFRDVEPTHLEILREVSEGWHIEYKSQSNGVKGIAKSLSAFANHHGGWIFYGVEERTVDGSKRAGGFPGVPLDDLESLLLQIREAASHHLSPTPHFDTRVLKGPVEAIGLAEANGIVVVRVPEGSNPPYVHSSGRIYRRKADESDPVVETDRGVLDLLWERRLKSEERLRRLLEVSPSVSKEEWEATAYLHLHLLLDPLAFPESESRLSLRDFSSIVGPEAVKADEKAGLALDNVFRCGDDFIGRHVFDNNPELLTVSFTYRPDCSSLTSIPMPILGPRADSAVYRQFVGSRSQGQAFLAVLDKQGHRNPRIVDLSLLLILLPFFIRRHRQVAAADGMRGPFFAKLVADNVWRVIPFVDTPWYVERVREHGAPIVQNSRLIAPWLLTDLIELDESIDDDGSDTRDLFGLDAGAIDVLNTALGSLGVPLRGPADDELRPEIVDLVVAALRAAGKIEEDDSE